MEVFNSYALSSVDQGVLFTLAALLSMGYHYIDRYMETKERLLDSGKAIWQVTNILAGMLIGSTAWASMYTLSNSEIVFAGIGLGLAAFGRGVSELGRTNEKRKEK